MGNWRRCGSFRMQFSEQEPLGRSGGGGRCAGLGGASAAAVEEASDWHAGDSGNASSRGPGAEQAATELLLCKMQPSPRALKINLLWFSNEVTGGAFCAF